MGIAERKEREKQQRRKEIVKAAEKVFFTKGFEESTMEDIAGEAELSKGTLYLYFKSKEDLHMAVAHKAISMLKSTMVKIEAGAGNAIEKLVGMGRATVDFSMRFPDHMKSIMFLEGFDLRQISFSANQMRDVIFRDSPVGMVIRIVEQGVEEKLIRNDIPPPIIAHTLWMQTLSVIRFVTMKTAIFEMLDLSQATIYESHFKLVLNGIRT
jgi:AcrR family transcriptional regulator